MQAHVRRPWLLATLAALNLVWLPAGAQDTNTPPPAREIIPASAFAERSFIESPELSPSGNRVAAPMNMGKERFLGIINLFDEPGKHQKGIRKFALGEARLRWHHWATDDLLLIGVLLEERGLYYSRLLAYDVVNDDARYLGIKREGLVGDDVLYVAPDGRFLLLSVAPNLWSYPAVHRVDIETGETTKVLSAKPPIHDWYADSNGVVRLGLGYVGRKTKIVYRDNDGEPFKTIGKFSWEDSDVEVDTIRFRQSGDKGFVITNAKTGRFGVYEFDWKTFDIGQPIFEHPTVDVDDFWTDRDGELSAILYTDDRVRVEWLDPKMKELQSEIDGALKNRSNWVVSRDQSQTRFIVWTTAADDPGHYYYYDRNAGLMTRLATPLEAVKSKALAPVEPIVYRSRDGLEIHGYLTLPRGAEAKNLPLIVLPHGGPHARDTWTYDPDVQFLANRGYAVLQPNFRGSSGYGKEFLEKGYGQWGGAMQDDVTDGVAWLVKEGIADPKRVCIMGISYGGYAALIGAIKTPELYRCAISYAGVMDIEAWMKSHRSDMLPKRYKKWRQKVRGEQETDLKSISPVKLADQVGVPLLLAHGTKDDRVPYKQADEMAKALKKANKTFEFLKLEGAGHGYEDEQQIQFLTAVEQFLAKHNPAN